MTRLVALRRHALTLAALLFLIVVGAAFGFFGAMRISSLFSRLGGQAPRWDHLSEAARFGVFHRTTSYIEEGAQLFRNGCAHCHAPDGSGGRGPALDGGFYDGVRGTLKLFQIVQNGVPGTEMPPSPQMAPREKLRVVAFVKSLRYEPPRLQGDIEAGAEVYDQSACASCHHIGNEGRVTGVDLTRVGARRSPQHLRESLVDPAADFPEGYLWVRVVTRDGRMISGARHYEDTFSIRFYDDQDQLHSFWKDEVQEFESLRGRSPMPSYEGVLSPSQREDLVAFLSSLR